MSKPNDQLIKDFFDQMKEHDQKVEMPTIENLSTPKKNRKRKYYFLSVAAVITVIICAFLVLNNAFESKEKKVLSNTEIDDLEQEIESIMSWSSATNDLIPKGY